MNFTGITLITVILPPAYTYFLMLANALREEIKAQKVHWQQMEMEMQ